MLTLNDGRSELWQWDTGRKLTVDADCTQVHFSNKFFGRSVDVDVFDGTAEIPDVLLQADKELLVWAFVGTAENGYTKISKVFKVNKRNKPADYVFTPTEQTTLDEIMNRLAQIEEGQDPDAIKNAVDEYLANNPIQVEEKDPTVPDWAKQPIKPKYTAKEVGAVATVNGKTPDENGNVEIEIPEGGTGSGLTTAQINALDGMFKVCAFTKPDVSAEYNAFKTAFGIGGEVEPDVPDVPDVPDEPDVPEKTLASISAVYSGGSVTVGTVVNDLTDIVVTAHYSDGTSKTVTGYTLSGTIAEGNNTITVTYQGKTATFTVTGVAESGGDEPDEPGDTTDTSPVIEQSGYALSTDETPKPYSWACYTVAYPVDGSANRTLKYHLPNYDRVSVGSAGKVHTFLNGAYETYYTLNYAAASTDDELSTYTETRFGTYDALKFTLVEAYKEDSYLYISETGEIIFAGKNTKYYGMSNISQKQG